MTKKQLIAVIKAMEDSCHIIANDEAVSEKMQRFEQGQASAFGTVIMMLENPKYAKEVAEIYGVNI